MVWASIQSSITQLSRTFLLQSMVFIHSFTWFSARKESVRRIAQAQAANERSGGSHSRPHTALQLTCPRAGCSVLLAQNTEWLAQLLSQWIKTHQIVLVVILKMTCTQFKGWNQLYHQPVLKFSHFFPASLQAKTAGISKLVDNEADSIL